MYQVYTQQRPGHPRWALGASAILLLATVGLAAALIRYKTGGDNVILKRFSVGKGLRAGLPADWKPLEQDQPEGTLVALAEPTDGQQPGRRLFIFLRPANFRLMSPAKMVQEAARDYARDVLMSAPSGGEMKDRDPPGDPTGEIAGRPGVTVLVELPPRTDRPAWFCLGRATILPQGVVIGVALQTVGETRRADMHLLDRVGRELDIPSLNPSGIPVNTDELPEVPAGMDPQS
ncbi:MAG TPA: hypothetical protein PKG54_16855 [Phycisphaerae bacterium]|jgi:hypothetical protein|nr:hypothetical protein [Phycisphaerae bacterium]HOB76185.1 hypothetical protein [Phycisphaerae bacterium]HOJ54576.1 hypothetical protein [Phycisphaerae bacterium]HOL27031.1 hypothetical protein [Phycisphaerae bacterium]HPP22817.1 hypothetical protein [Phycisphaerae bacterium]